MSVNSSIEWTEATWNPVTGCTKISPGCKHCYAERMALRLRAAGHPNYARGFEVAIHPNTLELPLSWRRPRMIFVNSMGDLFHELVPEAFVHDVFRVMHRAHWHTFQLLTKRSQRLAELGRTLNWPPNLWMGVTVESAEHLRRIDDLRTTGAAVKFLSLEPLLGPLPQLQLGGIDWVIVGGESGPGARPMRPEWATGIRDQCQEFGIAFFFKQWGGSNKKASGRLLDGRIWAETPSVPGRPDPKCLLTHDTAGVVSISVGPA